MDGLIRVDMNGIPFKYPGIELDTREFSKIVKEINNVYSFNILTSYNHTIYRHFFQLKNVAKKHPGHH